MVANETWVDTVEDGSIWDDGHNTAVFDVAGGIVDEHSMGSMPVVNELRQHCSPLYLGPRVFLLGARGGGNFYHWMTDILPKLAILRDAGYEFRDSDRFVVSTFNKAFQKETLKACGLSAEQIVASCDSSPYFLRRPAGCASSEECDGITYGWVATSISTGFTVAINTARVGYRG